MGIRSLTKFVLAALLFGVVPPAFSQNRDPVEEMRRRAEEIYFQQRIDSFVEETFEFYEISGELISFRVHPNMTQAELDKELKSITVDGNEGHLAELVGEKQTILAVIVERAGSAWFFKLQGDIELAAAEKKRFEAFVKSVKFK